MKLTELNNLSKTEARKHLLRCCGSSKWADMMTDYHPFSSPVDMKIISDKSWLLCNEEDWMEAFSHHPKIGEKAEQVKNDSASWAKEEQSGVSSADKNILAELEEGNKKYEEKFGYTFIICATGKSAGEILEILKNRMNNDAAKELHVAAGEQNQITHLRIDKLLS